MKLSTGFLTVLLMAGFLASGCSEGVDQVTGSPLLRNENGSQTAQSIGIAFNGVGTQVTLPSEDITWEFDPNCARAFFVVTSAGGANSGQQGAAITHVVMNNKCVFFQGGTLVGGTVVLGGKTIVVAPKNTTSYPATVPAAQCWSSTGSGGGGSVAIDFQADIAGESLVIRNSGNDFWEKKFSFSLLDGETSRVTDVAYYLEKWNGTGWDIVETVVVGTIDDITSGEWDHHYVANGGTFGSIITQLVSGHTIGAILDDTDGISGDNFANNNSDRSPDSDDNAEVAHGPLHSFSVSTAGSYRIRVAATVKENSGGASHSFTATGGGGSVIGAPNCN